MDMSFNLDPIRHEPPTLLARELLGSNLKQLKASMLYYEDEDVVSFVYTYESVPIALFLDSSAREALRNAFEEYDRMFSEKTLVNSRKTEAAYGKALALVKWGFILKTNYSYPSANIGYTFLKGQPYFTLSLEPSLNLLLGKESSTDEKDFSIYMRLFFTRKTMQELLNSFDDIAINYNYIDNENWEAEEY